MQYLPQDQYFQKAKKEGYRARSVYKLEAIQERFHLIRLGDSVLDLGAAPGSFLQYAAKLVGPKGKLVGIDLQPIKPFFQKNIHTLVLDVMEEEQLKEAFEVLHIEHFNVILSDLAPSTSGIRFLDSGRSKILNEQVIRIARKFLAPGGHLVLKLLSGVDAGNLKKPMKELFTKVKEFRPPAVRSSSGEEYLIGINRRSSSY